MSNTSTSGGTPRDARGRFCTSTETPCFDAVAGDHLAHVEALLAAVPLPAEAKALVAALDEGQGAG